MTLQITWVDVIATAIDDAGSITAMDALQQSLVLEEVTLLVHEDQYTKFTKIAQRYFAAHLAVTALQEAAGVGAISSQQIGNESITRTMPNNNPRAREGFLTTSYGRRFTQIQKSVVVPYRVINPSYN